MFGLGTMLEAVSTGRLYVLNKYDIIAECTNPYYQDNELSVVRNTLSTIHLI